MIPELTSLPSRFVRVGESMCFWEILSCFGWGFWAFSVRSSTQTHFQTTFMKRKRLNCKSESTNSILPCPPPLLSQLLGTRSWIVESKAVLNFIQFQGQSVLRRACPGWCQKLQLLPVLFPILLVQNPRIHAYFTPDSFSSLISYQWPHSLFLVHCSVSKKGTVWIS